MAGLLDYPTFAQQQAARRAQDPAAYGLLGPSPMREAMGQGLLGMLPGIGDVMSVNDAYEGVRDRDWLRAGLGLLGALPLIPAVGGAVKSARGTAKAGKAAKSLPLDDASRLRRAADIGFDPTDYYHATSADIRQFDLSRAGSNANVGNTAERAVFLTSSPDVADTYLGGGFVRSDAPGALEHGVAPIGEGAGRWYLEGSNVMPLRVRGMDDFDVWDMGGGGYSPDFMQDALREARKNKAKGVIFENMRDPGMMGLGRGKSSDIVAVLDPRLIRSRFANFDPAKINSRDIMAGIAGAGLLGVTAGMLPEE